MDKEKCKADGCNNERYGLKEYCRKHYLQIKKHGRLTPELEVNKISKGEICSIDVCERQVYAKNLCYYHYSKQRELKFKQQYKLGLVSTGKCKVEGCDDIALAKGYCKRHYKQIKKYNKIISVERLKNEQPKICIIEDCCEESHSCGYCKKHYNKFKKYGDPLYGRTYITNKAK